MTTLSAIQANDVTRAETARAVSEIPFIPNDDFDSTSEQDFAEIDIELYAEEEDRPTVADPDLLAENFVRAVEQSRLLTFEGEQFLFRRLNFLRFRASALQKVTASRRRAAKNQKEIERLLQEADQTREQIARSNLRLVVSIARKHSSSEEECDDFVAEANAILLNAIDKFDFARGYRFSTYATHAIQRHLFRVIGRRNKRQQREGNKDEVVFQLHPDAPAEEGPSAQDILSAAQSILDQMDNVLTDRERHIVRGRFGLNETGKGQTLRELGEELGISKERVRQILQQSVDKLGTVAQPFRSTFSSDW